MAQAPKATAAHRQATAHDVARAAGVSQSAVSRAFTPGASVAPETRARIVEAARALGYRPNLVARSLITRRSRIIGVAMAYLQNQFYPAALEALSRRLRQAGYHVLLLTPEQQGVADPLLEDVLSIQADALVLASTSLSSPFAAECAAAGVPVVLFNRTSDAAAVSSVAGDNLAGARAIAAFLAAGGHRRFGYIAGLPGASTNREREAGYTGWLAEQGLGPVARAEGAYDFETARAAARRLLSGPDRPDALFCANDHMALAAMEVARHELGLDVPGEVSIVGFDDAGPAPWPSFGLTTYSQPVGPMVEALAGLLLDLLGEAGAPARRLLVPGELIVRRSARLPRAGLVQENGLTLWRG